MKKVLVLLLVLSAAAAYAAPMRRDMRSRIRGTGGGRGGIGTVSGSPPPAATGNTGCSFSSAGPLFPCTFGG